MGELAGRDGAGPIDGFLGQLDAQLKVGPRERRRILEEARTHLELRAAQHPGSGTDAEHAAVAAFGEPAALAAQFERLSTILFEELFRGIAMAIVALVLMVFGAAIDWLPALSIGVLFVVVVAVGAAVTLGGVASRWFERHRRLRGVSVPGPVVWWNTAGLPASIRLMALVGLAVFAVAMLDAVLPDAVPLVAYPAAMGVGVLIALVAALRTTGRRLPLSIRRAIAGAVAVLWGGLALTVGGRDLDMVAVVSLVVALILTLTLIAIDRRTTRPTGRASDR